MLNLCCRVVTLVELVLASSYYVNSFGKVKFSIFWTFSKNFRNFFFKPTKFGAQFLLTIAFNNDFKKNYHRGRVLFTDFLPKIWHFYKRNNQFGSIWKYFVFLYYLRKSAKYWKFDIFKKTVINARFLVQTFQIWQRS